MSPDDAKVVAAQLGRPPRGTWTVRSRCAEGAPVVISVAPRLDDGSPFPTTFWLTCPRLVDAVGALESSGEGTRHTARADADGALRADLLAADTAYRAERAALAAGDDPCAAVGIAGQRDPLAVKCLHARVAAHLAGVPDPIGAEVAAHIAGFLSLPCADGRCAFRDSAGC